MKLFYLEMFFGLDWEEITSNGQKHFQETIIVCATKAMRKQQINNHLWEILFLALACKVVSSRKSSLTG